MTERPTERASRLSEEDWAEMARLGGHLMCLALSMLPSERVIEIFAAHRQTLDRVGVEIDSHGRVIVRGRV